MRLISRVCALFVLAVVVASCRYEPAEDVVDNPIPQEMQSLSLDAIEAQIIAGGTGPWQIRRVSPGLLAGDLSVRSHAARVDILVTQKSYTIRHVSTTNLEKNGSIHRNYNRWVQSLQQQIDTHLARYAATPKA